MPRLKSCFHDLHEQSLRWQDQNMRMRIHRKDAYMVLFAVPRVLGEYYFSPHPFSFVLGKRVFETQQTESLLQAVFVFLLLYLCFPFLVPFHIRVIQDPQTIIKPHDSPWALCKVFKCKMIGTHLKDCFELIVNTRDKPFWRLGPKSKPGVSQLAGSSRRDRVMLQCFQGPPKPVVAWARWNELVDVCFWINMW